MRIAKVLVATLALIGAASASAQDYVTVERRSSTAGTIMRDTMAGVMIGSAVSGGIILYNTVIQDHENYDWGRTLAWGAIIGLGAGLVFGIVDATSAPSYAMAAPPVPIHDGQSLTLDLRRADRSGTALFPVVLGRF